MDGREEGRNEEEGREERKEEGEREDSSADAPDALASQIERGYLSLSHNTQPTHSQPASSASSADLSPSSS